MSLKVKYNGNSEHFEIDLGASGIVYETPERVLECRDAAMPVRQTARVAKANPGLWVAYERCADGEWKPKVVSL